MNFQNILYYIIAASIMFGGCSHTAPYRHEDGMAWNTLYHITYQCEEDLGDSIILVLNEIDRSLSPFNDGSVVARINRNLSDSVDSHFTRVYEESRRINRESEGAFDPTLAPIIRAWGFGEGHKVSADTLRLDSLLQLVGIARTEISGTRLIKENPAIEFNFSALAKGYGVDCIAEMLRNNGVANYLVEVGGEIRLAGVNESGKPWTVGIDRPEFDSKPGETVEKISLSEGAIATSGNYRNFHEKEGGRFGHTISPVTGRPVESDVISATVIAPTCMEADALATCCMVVGSEAALNLCTRLRAAVMLIKADMEVVSNPAFRAFAGVSGPDAEPGTADRD